MSYIEGYVAAVPRANKNVYREHAAKSFPFFKKLGATHMVENWGDDVPDGKVTDFKRAVKAKPDEDIIFSWVEYPDKATRDKANELMMNDPQAQEMGKNMPFDGKRMIYGGFESIVEQGERAGDGYMQGFVIPVPTSKREQYRHMAEEAWVMFKGYGALRVVEAWGDDVPDGKVTDFRRAVKAEPDEKIVFAFMEWPSRAVCDAAHERMMKDERMKPTEGMEMPFDAKRMIYAGFFPVVTLEK